MNEKKKIYFVLVAILLVAAFLRVYKLNQHDVITDEVFYGYRSIGLIDSLNSPVQPTPYETVQVIPFWMKLSFHDHPPLGFWIEHLSFKIFGVNLWGLRLPFALAGVASVFFVFLIGRMLFSSEIAGLLAAGILAVGDYSVWISRIGLQEGLVIFFMLLAVWLFLKTLTDPRYFYWTAATVGVALLMKYTAVILLPIFFTFLLWKRRDLLSWRRIVFGGLLILAIFSPVIIYNAGLYMTAGHFDFQISYFLGQRVPEWQVRPGRDVGGLFFKLTNFFIRFWQNFGLVFSVLSVFALAAIWPNRRKAGFQFVWLAILFLFLLLLAIGSQERFLAMLSPFLALAIASSALALDRKWLWGALGILMLWELAFTVNTNLLVRQRGLMSVTYSNLWKESSSWGYNQLESYFESVTAGYYSKQIFPSRFAFVTKLQEQALAQDKKSAKKPVLILFVADSNMEGPAMLWYATRHTVYERWPFIDENAYLGATADDPDYFFKQGFEQVVFIKAWNTLLQPGADIEPSRKLEKIFQARGSTPISIVDPQGRLAFGIYPLDKP